MCSLVRLADEADVVEVCIGPVKARCKSTLQEIVINLRILLQNESEDLACSRLRGDAVQFLASSVPDPSRLARLELVVQAQVLETLDPGDAYRQFYQHLIFMSHPPNF